MSRAPLRVAVLGAGTVGREVVRGLLDDAQWLTPSDGPPLMLAGVAVRDVDRARASGIPSGLLTDAPAHLVASPETDVIVELIGGEEPARTLIAAALTAGKAVVTANKHVIAHHGPQLEATARQTGAALRFEAAVGGGIPVLGPLASDLAGNHLTAVRGIVNGTTNYILTAMTDEGRGYDEVLAAAQSAGYAEADPSGDVEGHDAVNKLVILARLAFGVWLDRGSIVTARPGEKPGITGVTSGDLEAASKRGRAIRLVAAASRTADGSIEAKVLPTECPLDSPLGQTHGVRNRIEIETDQLGWIGIEGPGAGGAATASAVLADLVAIAAIPARAA